MCAESCHTRRYCIIYYNNRQSIAEHYRAHYNYFVRGRIGCGDCNKQRKRFVELIKDGDGAAKRPRGWRGSVEELPRALL